MQNALFVGVSSQVALQRELDVIANNMANVSTNGFKARNSRFQEYLMPVASADSFQRPDRRALLRHRPGHGPRPRPGADRADRQPPPRRGATARPSSRCRRRTGERYTRNGAFETDAQGTLVTSDGYPVLGDGGPIQIGPQETGALDRPRRHGLDQPRHPRPGPPRHLRQSAGADQRGRQPLRLRPRQPQPAGLAGRLEPGALERSNVKPVIEMTRLMDVNRTYTMVSGVISRLDDLRGTAIRRLADVA